MTTARSITSRVIPRLITVDRATAGLGRAITEGTLDGLDEAGGVLGGLKSVAGTAKNMALSALGNGAATGKLEQQTAANHLWQEFGRFTRGSKPFTLPVIHQFFVRTFGQAAADQLAQNLFHAGGPPGQNTPPPLPQPPQTPPNGRENPPNGTAPNGTETASSTQTANDSPPAPQATPVGQAPADAKAAGPADGANPTDAAGTAQKVMQQPTAIADVAPNATPGALVVAINQAASARKPDRTEVMRLVHQLLANTKAKGQNAPEFRQAIANLKNMQVALGDRVPELKQIDLSAFSEAHIRQVAGLTRYLVEYRITNRAAIDAACARFLRAPLFEAPTNAPPNDQPAASPPPNGQPLPRVLSKQAVMKLFFDVAGMMLDTGGMSVGKPQLGNFLRGKVGQFLGQHPRWANQADGDDGHGNRGGGGADYSGDNNQHGGRSGHADPNKTYVNVEALRNNLAHVDDPMKDRVALMASNTMTLNQLYQQASREAPAGTQLSSAIIAAIMAAHG